MLYNDVLFNLQQERDALQGHMRSMTAESSTPGDGSSELVVSLQTQLAELQSKLSEETEERQRLEVSLRARQELDSRRQELEAKRQEMRSFDKQLAVQQVEIKSFVEETSKVNYSTLFF